MGRSLIAKGVSGVLSLKPKTSKNRKYKRVLNKGEKSSTPSKILKTRFVDKKNGRIFYANENSDANIVIIYLHGGAYSEDFLPFHWVFLRKIIKYTNAKIIAPAYRLAPFGTYKEAFDLIIPLYEECIKSNNKVIIMGDSAGGGLAMALAIHFKINKIKLPNELILISPWIDVVMDNPEITKYQKKDPMLSIKMLKSAVKPWIGELDEHDWHVSPIYGDLSGINNITIFAGTREILYPDILKFYNKLDRINNNLIIGKEMNHAYPLMPIPEAKSTIISIVDIIKR